jgi:cyclophilin family peptidyl-prolyl cis-trans isomerase
VFGRVTEGMDVVETIGKVKTGRNDRPVEEVKMLKVTIA